MAGRWKAFILAFIATFAVAYYGTRNRAPAVKPADTHPPPVLVAGVSEPDQLRVEPVPLPTVSTADKALAAGIQKLGSKNAPQDILSVVNPVLASYTDYADGYILRLGALCQIQNSKHAAIISDIDAALKYHPHIESSSVGPALAMKAKLEYVNGQAEKAMEDLEMAMKSDLDNAFQIFNNGQVAPGDVAPSWCNWNETDFTGFVAKFPNDYRAYLLRGLYYTFFATYNEPSITPALENIQHAVALNSQSSLAHYFLAEVYLHGHFWKRLGSDTLRAAENQAVIRELDQAINIDSKLVPALAARAGVYLGEKQFGTAILDFDRVLQIDPDNQSALHDEALSKLESNDPSGAISGFTRAIDKMNDSNSLANAYENRADAYLKTHQYGEGAGDLTKALSYHISSTISLMSLAQFRTIYPEYASASDEAVMRKIDQTFVPQIKYDDFAKSFADPAKAPFETSLIKDLYVKRADAYLLAGQYRKASVDYKRAVTSFAKYADSVDRWQPIQTGSAITFFVDLKSTDFSHPDAMRVWTKQTKAEADQGGPYSLDQYEINCSSGQIKPMSTANYNAGGNLVASREYDKWYSVIPGTIGEGQPHRLDTLAGSNAGRLFDGFEETKKGCSK